MVAVYFSHFQICMKRYGLPLLVHFRDYNPHDPLVRSNCKSVAIVQTCSPPQFLYKV